MDDDYAGFANLIDAMSDGANDKNIIELSSNNSFSQEQLLNSLDSEIKNISNNIFGKTEQQKHATAPSYEIKNHKILNDKLDLLSGHRQRAKERFLASPHTISDVDLLELALFLLIPRADTKSIAKKLLLKFKTYKGIITAPEEEITQNGINGKNVRYLFTLLKELGSRYLAQNLQKEGMEISNIEELVHYCKSIFCDKIEEEFHILFFNNQMQLIVDKQIGINNISDVSLDIRSIIKITLDLYAKNIVLTHNHPSASCEPSKDDIITTETIKNFMQTISVRLIDHIIIANNDYFSFAEHHLV